MKSYAFRSLSLFAGHKIRAPFHPFSVKSHIVAALSVIALALVFGGCEQKEKAAGPAPEDKVLFQAIQDNADALNKKDIDGVMATIHPQSKSFDKTRGDVGDAFNDMTRRKVTVKFTMSDLKVKDASSEEAHVSFVQKTDQMEGDRTIPLYLLEGVDTLKPDNGKWKILETVVTKTTHLHNAEASTPQSAAPSTEPAPAPATSAPTTPATPTPAAPSSHTATPAPTSTPTATEPKPAAPDQQPPAPGEKPPQ